MFDRIFAGLAGEGPAPQRIMVDATHLKAHRTAASLLKKGMFPVVSGEPSGLNSKLHTVCDGDGRPIASVSRSDERPQGRTSRADALPPADHLIADRGYDSTWFREELEARGVKPCIQSSQSRKMPFAYDKVLYRRRHKVENLFAKLKDWWRSAMRYDRCAHTFFSAIGIAAAVIFRLY